ncbi:predicted protein, partial [Nematostella vectensis]
AAERAQWAQEKAESQNTIRAANEEIARLKEDARKAGTERSSDSQATWPQAKVIQKLYSRYVRAESFRKGLVYQKRYLLLLLGGFQECEQTTLAMISRMGAYPSYPDVPKRRPPAYTRFRSAVRTVIAIKRMRFLVAKAQRTS